MEKMKSEKQVVKRPYDQSLEDNLEMYDKIPYDRDETLCNITAVTLESGNIIKNYRCNITEPYQVLTSDDK